MKFSIVDYKNFGEASNKPATLNSLKVAFEDLEVRNYKFGIEKGIEVKGQFLTGLPMIKKGQWA